MFAPGGPSSLIALLDTTEVNMSTSAREIIQPPDTNIFRTVFLYVGQGDATLHLIPDGSSGFKYVLVDINRSEKLRCVDVVAVLEDLLPRERGKPVLDVFLNTHPHSDHLRGIDELRRRVRVKEVWHTGFKPSDAHDDAYNELQDLIVAVQEDGGEITEYRGTRKAVWIGGVFYNVLSPADHAKDEIDELKGDARDSRIHDYCGVLRFGYGSPPGHVMITGDAGKSAWKDYILGTEGYHAERLPCSALSASHHGSRSFFKDDENDEDPYTRHLELMAPDWVVVSSPVQSDSPHGHPHDDAIELYRAQVSEDHIRVLGKRPESIIYDITTGGDCLLDSDDGELIDQYPFGGENGGNGGSKAAAAAVITSKLDSGRPMGVS
jgi:beta-lactamase superfamily II metal-dependent hydrolase